MNTHGSAHEEAWAKAWMTYIDTELRGLCKEKGWRPPQIRRKWSVREVPVSSSGIDDYEWKLIPFEKTPEMEHDPADDEWGTYFVLKLDSTAGKFALEHDNHYVGMYGDHWVTSTLTEIDLVRALWLHGVSSLVRERKGIEWRELVDLIEDRAHWWEGLLPPPGFLSRILSSLTSRFGPNSFSIT